MYGTPERGAEQRANQWITGVAMKVIAANLADSLRRPGESESAEMAILDSVREELRSFFGEADDTVPLSLATLAQQLDHAGPPPSNCIA